MAIPFDSLFEIQVSTSTYPSADLGLSILFMSYPRVH